MAIGCFDERERESPTKLDYSLISGNFHSCCRR
jgi:hypothetical protein